MSDARPAHRRGEGRHPGLRREGSAATPRRRGALGPTVSAEDRDRELGVRRDSPVGYFAAQALVILPSSTRMATCTRAVLVRHRRCRRSRRWAASASAWASAWAWLGGFAAELGAASAWAPVPRPSRSAAGAAALVVAAARAGLADAGLGRGGLGLGRGSARRAADRGVGRRRAPRPAPAARRAPSAGPALPRGRPRSAWPSEYDSTVASPATVPTVTRRSRVS